MSSLSILDKKVSVQPDLVARNNEDGTVVVMRMDESNLFFKIDGIAADIWKGLNANQDLKQVFAQIKANYEAHMMTVHAHINIPVYGEKLILKP